MTDEYNENPNLTDENISEENAPENASENAETQAPEQKSSDTENSNYRDFFSDPSGNEYEVSYNSGNGTSSYTGSYQAARNAEKKKEKSHTGALVATICICLVLSCLLGSVFGALVSYAIMSRKGQTVVDNGSAQVTHKVIDEHTTVVVNNGEVARTAIMDAANTAKDSAVIIDIYMNEEYEQLNQPLGSGSGVIWTADGHIVTCNHVVDGVAGSNGIIKVTLNNGKKYNAAVVGTDAKTDLAVIKINATETLTPVMVRGTDLILGETVLAIGNPLGVLGGTCTSGILSALERTITVEGQTMTLLQMDASVNEGNSGGGLFDINGSLIGIVNAKSMGDNVEGIGFAIPINTVHTIANELIEHGYVTGRPQLGITVVTVSESNYSYIFGADYYPELKEYATKSYRDGWGQTRTQVVTGLYIYSVENVKGYEEGSDKLQFGDQILYVGDVKISEMSDIRYALNDYSSGDTISVTILRNQKDTVIVKVILGQAKAVN